MTRLPCVAVFIATILPAPGCKTPTAAVSNSVPAATAITPTRIDYVDSDAFDALLESALVNQDAAIIIQTPNQKPDWGDRLNAWIAAWNMAGRSATGERFRMQAPLLPKVVVDGDSIREFRLLVESLMGGLEERARQGWAWLAEEKVRSRRVRLLKPYNLRFHRDENGFVQIILFNGRYAPYYQEFLRSLAAPETGEEWERKYSCSECAMRREESSQPRNGMRLTSGGKDSQ